MSKKPHKQVNLPVITEEPRAKQQCSTCKHFKQVPGEPYGRCHRFPPVPLAMAVLTNHGPIGIFPITLQDSLCGEFTPILT